MVWAASENLHPDYPLFMGSHIPGWFLVGLGDATWTGCLYFGHRNFSRGHPRGIKEKEKRKEGC